MGSLFAGPLKVAPIFILVLPGLIAAALFQDVKGDEAYTSLLAANILPIGIKGIVLSGLLAAIMFRWQAGLTQLPYCLQTIFIK